MGYNDYRILFWCTISQGEIMTYRELINQVLIRLREDTVASDWSGAINDSSTVNDYQKVLLLSDIVR